MSIGDCIPLEENKIKDSVREGSPGNYLLFDKKYKIRYVGRSDTDVQRRLLDHVNETHYSCFKFWYANSPEEAYRKECEQYHRHVESGNLLNINHPDCPNGMGYLRCPVCYIPL